MDLSALKGSLLYRSGLADLLGGNRKSDLFDSVSQGLSARIDAITDLANTSAETASGGSTSVTLSDEARALLAAANGGVEKDAKVTGVQKMGQNFLMGFFDQNGLDFKTMSAESLDIITGLQEVIASSGAVSRDMTTDLMEGKYTGGDRKAYTLVGPDTRLRVAIDYKEGKPSKLSVTDISGGRVETAEITLNEEKGKISGMTISRTQREYSNGHMVSLAPLEPMTIKLYKAA